MTRIKHPQWRDGNLAIKYPFQDKASLVNLDGLTFSATQFLDAAFYATGGAAGGYLSRVVISPSEVSIWYGDGSEELRASTTFQLTSPPETLVFSDRYGRAAGMLITDPLSLAAFQSWPTGEHAFTVEETGLVAACCMPVPEIGVTGLVLDDGSTLTGDVFLVGDNGVILSCDEIQIPGTCGVPPRTQRTIRVDVVGDPLWRRRDCSPDRFDTPRFIKQVTFQQGSTAVSCGPGEFGDLKLAIGRQTADTVLRLTSRNGSLMFEVVGEKLRKDV